MDELGRLNTRCQWNVHVRICRTCLQTINVLYISTSWTPHTYTANMSLLGTPANAKTQRNSRTSNAFNPFDCFLQSRGLCIPRVRKFMRSPPAKNLGWEVLARYLPRASGLMQLHLGVRRSWEAELYFRGRCVQACQFMCGGAARADACLDNILELQCHVSAWMPAKLHTDDVH